MNQLPHFCADPNTDCTGRKTSMSLKKSFAIGLSEQYTLTLKSPTLGTKIVKKSQCCSLEANRPNPTTLCESEPAQIEQIQSW